jgi:hypothetical protein
VFGLAPEPVYGYRVYSVNRVGTSVAISSQIQIGKLMSAPKSRITMLDSTVSSGALTNVKIKSVDPISGLAEGAGGRTFTLSVENICELDITGQICVPVKPGHPYYTDNRNEVYLVS